MALTLTKLNNHLLHALAGNVATEMSPRDIINEAGEQLYSAHSWRFRERPPTTVTFTDSQEYVNLPIDYGETTAYALNGLTTDFCWTTAQEIAGFRDNAIHPTGFKYWGTVVQPLPSHRSDEMPPQRIELYPTPGSGTLALWYRARWVNLQNTNEVAIVPQYAETLLIQLVRAFARGREEDDIASLEMRLEEIWNGRSAKSAKRADSLVQNEYGSIGGGAVQMAGGNGLGYLDGRTSYSALT